MASRVAALFLLGVICFEFAAAEIVTDCCLETSEKRFHHKNIVVDYIIQEAGNGCDISATVFITRNKKTLCVVPHHGNSWVQNIINSVDRRKKGRQ